jgi:hypothetical protein
MRVQNIHNNQCVLKPIALNMTDHRERVAHIQWDRKECGLCGSATSDQENIKMYFKEV